MLKEGFAIKMMLDPRIPASDVFRFQYRQYIRGTISVQEGSWRRTGGGGMSWLPYGTLRNENSVMRVPGGLHPNTFREDGFDHRNGRVERYGYRDRPAQTGDNGEVRDQYRGGQRTGHVYEATDFAGLEFDLDDSDGRKVNIDLQFIGKVVDIEFGDREVARLQWAISGSETVNLAELAALTNGVPR